MSATLVDANVLIDVLTEDDEWFDWSSSMLEDAAHQGSLIINPIIYAEVSLGFTRIEDLDEALPLHYYRRAELPWAAGFLAAKAMASARAFAFAGRNPANRKRSVGKPASVSAAIAAHGPGRVWMA